MMLIWSYLFIFYTQKDIEIDIKDKLNAKLPLTYLVASNFQVSNMMMLFHKSNLKYVNHIYLLKAVIGCLLLLSKAFRSCI